MSDQTYELSVPAGAEPVKYREVVQDLIGEKRTAEEMNNRTFLILKGHPFKSKYENQKVNPWFVICVDVETGVKFNMVLGGEAVVPILEAYAASNPTGPLEVTLNFLAGAGSEDGYYQFS